MQRKNGATQEKIAERRGGGGVAVSEGTLVVGSVFVFQGFPEYFHFNIIVN